MIDRYRIHEPEATTAEGYRLVWYHSSRKAELDALTRHKRIERATTALTELRAKLTSPRTRYRDQAKVALAVEAILRDGEAEGLLIVEIEAKTTETYRQERRGRRGPDTRYVRSEATRFDLSWRIDHDRLAVEARCDGVFPLVSNVTTMSALDLLLAYKQQPMIEKRFSQLKTDFVVAPVFLKEVSRIQALLCVYFLALLVESLLERELRRAMEREGVESLPLYPEGRACRRPTARRVIDLFEDVQRHELTERGQHGGRLHHGADPPATQDPPPAGDAQGLQRLIPQAVGNSRIFSGRCAESRKNYLRSSRYGAADRPDLLRVQADLPPRLRRRLQQGVIVQIDPIRPVMGAEVVPQVLHRVQLRRVGQQPDQAHVRRHHQGVADVVPRVVPQAGPRGPRGPTAARTAPGTG